MNYLIPANTKKSLLIFSVFTPFDLMLFGAGLGTSLLLLLILPVDKALAATAALAPGIICGFLVMPVPNYHNMISIIKSALNFYNSRQKYIWKGWCINEQTKQK